MDTRGREDGNDGILMTEGLRMGGVLSEGTEDHTSFHTFHFSTANMGHTMITMHTVALRHANHLTLPRLCQALLFESTPVSSASL